LSKKELSNLTPASQLNFKTITVFTKSIPVRSLLLAAVAGIEVAAFPVVPVIAESVVQVVQDAAEEGFRSGCKYANELISFFRTFYETLRRR
jgi:hypothetical protein